MNGDAADPLLLGQRVVAILETGLRTATYKLATLMALIEHCIENMPALSEDALQVPIPDLARRVLEIYWRQVRPFDGQELRQSTQPRARILAATNELRAAAGFGVDGDAMNAAFEAGGQVVGVLADALERSVTRRGTRRGVAGGQMCLVTPYPPSAPFSVGNAMGRNKIIYALSRCTIVVASDHETGGTWAGATEALKNG